MKNIRLLNYLKRDEKNAPSEYRKLLPHLKTVADKRAVRGIIRDEESHLRILKGIRRLK